MQRETIQSLSTDHLKALDRYSSQIAGEFDLELIHRLRVEVKKFRAFLRLYASAHEEKKARIPGRLKELYNIAGHIRDAQMQLVRAILERSEALTGYALWLTNFIAAGQQEWKNRYRPRILDEWQKQMRRVEWKMIDTGQLLHFFREKIHALGTIARKAAPDDEDLHDIRKVVKDLQHLSRLSEQHWPEGKETLAVLPFKELDQLAQRAGDYNDERNALERLQQYIDTLAGPSRDLLQLRDTWQRLKEANRAALIDAIATFRSKAALLTEA